MNKKTLTIAIATALGVTALVGIAFAAKGHHGARHGGPMIDLAERYDGNKDGLVTQNEIDGNRAEWHAKFDADKSGDLSLTEFQALWTQAHKDRMVREFQEFDANGDAKVLLDEYKKPLATIVADLDSNGDKALGKDDRMARHGKRHHSGMMDGMDNEGPPQPPTAD